ncbi:DNA-binding transcriptional regulator GbsR (MarR family) [Paenibacillus taihuensis]|uniref:HTH-type transcriptional regulator n=1 Tax=Paenibacillus taihuensis TaxID=1156355 RepID=A0A3D9SAB3_9BACL|nr:transcriptional regulator [Paenibacillus taihuensis]REE86523.1 DNA-binding transcriptional regulator GbsR (MarR family) [Paenibacillus taihuensis]
MKKSISGKMKEPSSAREEIRVKVIDAIAQTMDLYGVNYSFGQLYGILFFEDRPMTLEEMQTSMNMSKSNMSYAVRSLTDSKMVSKLDEKAGRQDLYAAETDFFKAFQLFFASKLQREIDVMTAAIKPVIEPLSETILALETSEEERKLCLQDLHKLRHAVRYYEWLQQFVDKLEDGQFFEGQQIGD